MGDFEKYRNFSRHELIHKIHTLQKRLNQSTSRNGPQEAATKKHCAAKKKQPRSFDFSKYNQRHIALKLLYIGWDYFGLATQEEVQETIEHHLFYAFKKSCLIEDRKFCEYQRCGRTDKSVSAFSQVVSLRVRSKHKSGLGVISCAASEDLLVDSPHDSYQEINYISILNSILPSTIRVISWAPVSLQFDARFCTLSRTYRYYFIGDGYDINAMQQAAKIFEGVHDFRNFCKMDIANNITNYMRRILECSIIPIYKVTKPIESSLKMDIASIFYSFGSESVTSIHNYSVFALQVNGTAFLWHQIRCMMGVLFLIGKGFETPEVITALLDIEKCPRKPHYNMAPPEPLVLYDVLYDHLPWICQKEDMKKLDLSLRPIWKNLSTQTAVVQDMLAGMDLCCIRENCNNESLQFWGKLSSIEKSFDETPRHIPLLERKFADSLEERLAFKRARNN